MSPEAYTRLATLHAAGQNPIYMTGQEGAELVELGYIIPDQNKPGTVPGSCLVVITQAGINALQSQTQAVPPPAATPKSKPVVGEIEQGIAIPVVKRGGSNNLTPRKSDYNFDGLGEPQPNPADPANPICPSFHVSDPSLTNDPDGEALKKLAAKISSSVSAANKRSEVEVTDPAGTVLMVTKEKKTLVRGEDGKALLDANGKRQYTLEQVTVPQTQPTKKFVARKVNAQDPKGVGVRVFRVPLDY